MGFGYLFLGYLLTFVLYLTIQALGFGGLALLGGYSLMLYGLWQLNHYHRGFAYAKWSLIPLLLTALYDTMRSLDRLLLWRLPFVNDTLDTVYSWTVFLLILFFNFAMLYGIRAIAEEVELPRIKAAAIRNSVFVILYAVLYLIGNLPILQWETVRAYIGLPLVLVQIVWIACNLILILGCTKDICRAGDEEQTPKRYRWEWINQIGDAYARNRQRTVDRTRQDAEEALRRRKERRESKKIQHSKKKKK